MWSCCLAEEIHARGCIDDNSIGIRSDLPKMKNSFHNYVKLPTANAQSLFLSYGGETSQLHTSTSRIDSARRPNSQNGPRHHSQPSHSHQNHSSHSRFQTMQQTSSGPPHSNTTAATHQQKTSFDFSQFQLQATPNDSFSRSRNLFINDTSPRDSSQFLTQQQSVMTLSKESIGKVRPGSANTPRLIGNRPMSSPAGFRLYQRS
jgi:hypothetical protein